MEYTQGDKRRPTLTVEPYDGTTSASVVILDPDGVVVTSMSATTSDGGRTWTAVATYTLTKAGSWIERWTVTGTGASEEDLEVLVAPRLDAAPSGARVYATTTDYATFLRKAPPTGARRALAEASREVDRMLLCSVYKVDADGYPTDPEDIEAIRDATCAQAEYAADLGDDNSVGTQQWHSVAIGSVQLARASGPRGSEAPGAWSAKAWSILQQAGLVGHEPQTW